MGDLTLLEKYKPLSYISKKEKYDLVNAIDYFQNNHIVYDASLLCASKVVGSKTYLYYWYSFEKDAGKDILGIFKDVDDHKDDIECIVVELTNSKLTGVCYMPHATAEHFWIRDKNDLTKILHQSDHPIVYIANDKHALYPISGPIYRYIFFVNDNCSSPVVKKTNLVLINTYLTNRNSIGEGMVGFGRRVKKDISTISVIRLKDLQCKGIFSYFF